jgi:cyclin L
MAGLTTLLDRSIPVQLPHVDETASRRDSISAGTERLHRLHGTSIVQQACRILSAEQLLLPHENNDNGAKDDWALVDATACVLLHRFLQAVSLRDMDVWSVAMASTFLAAKLHDVPLTIRALILAYIHIYRQRTLLVIMHGQKGDPDEMAASLIQRYSDVLAISPSVHALPWAARRTILQHDVPAVSTAGPVWKEWHDAVVRTEQAILRQLGFVLYWIPESHPHWYAAPLVHALVHIRRSNLDAQSNDDDVATTNTTAMPSSVVETQLLHDTLRYCQLSSRLDLCLRMEPAVICTAAIHCALLQMATTTKTSAEEDSTKLPLAAPSLSTGPNDNDDDPWWMVFCSNVKSTPDSQAAMSVPHEPPPPLPRQQLAQDLSNAVNALLGLEDETNLDVQMANHAYVTSLNGGSFVDPTSFVWEMLVDRPSSTASNGSATKAPR